MSNIDIIVPSEGGGASSWDRSAAIKRHYIRLFVSTDTDSSVVSSIRISGIPVALSNNNTVGALVGLDYNYGLHEFRLSDKFSALPKVSEYVSNLNKIIKNNTTYEYLDIAADKRLTRSNLFHQTGISYHQASMSQLLSPMPSTALSQTTIMATYPVYGSSNNWRSHAAGFVLRPPYNDTTEYYGAWTAPSRVCIIDGDAGNYYNALMTIASSDYWNSSTCYIFAANTTSGTTYKLQAHWWIGSNSYPVSSSLSQMSF